MTEGSVVLIITKLKCKEQKGTKEEIHYTTKCVDLIKF